MHPAEQPIKQAIIASPKDGIDINPARGLLQGIADPLVAPPGRVTNKGVLFLKDQRATRVGHRYLDERRQSGRATDHGADGDTKRCANVEFYAHPSLWNCSPERAA